MESDQEPFPGWHELQEPLRRYLVRAFPRLQSEAEDILQEVFLQALERARCPQEPPVEDWPRWFRTVVRHRAIDRLRQWERRAFRQLSGQSTSSSSSSWEGSSWKESSFPDPSDPSPGPATQAAEKQRRHRQGLLLSEVLVAFCRFCEAKPTRLPMKEAYERALRGQKPEQIASAMQLPPAQVHQLLYRARQWILTRIQQADVDRSVFLTLFAQKGEPTS
ncbi:MAG: hypothetical protein NZ602_04500 [Thermoguttaceae bacterium]|nr:hypothetical protein [Thermoguttaceae bacterium]MDW8037840.1 sigma factor [Thermoguttaceae bacterium]